MSSIGTESWPKPWPLTWFTTPPTRRRWCQRNYWLCCCYIATGRAPLFTKSPSHCPGCERNAKSEAATSASLASLPKSFATLPRCSAITSFTWRGCRWPGPPPTSPTWTGPTQWLAWRSWGRPFGCRRCSTSATTPTRRCPSSCSTPSSVGAFHCYLFACLSSDTDAESNWRDISRQI